jgi:hypothetical protein
MTGVSPVALLVEQSERTRAAMRIRELRGWDPYDALLSPLFRLPLLRSRRLPRFAAQQLVLRSPVNLRPLLRVPEQRNPVTVALYLQGIADLVVAGRLDHKETAAEAAGLVAFLAEMSAPGQDGRCWGYPFPWEGRRHRMPTGFPTVVATGIVVNSLYRAWKVLGLFDP